MKIIFTIEKIFHRGGVIEKKGEVDRRLGLCNFMYRDIALNSAFVSTSDTSATIESERG